MAPFPRTSRRPLATVAFVVVSSLTCDAVTEPTVEPVVLAFAGADSVVGVGRRVAVTVTATVGGVALDPAWLVLSSSDSTVLAVRGDSVEARRRGAATITVAVASAALRRDAAQVMRRFFAVADTVVAESAAVTFTSLGDTVTLAAAAFDADGDVLADAVPQWRSSDTAVVRVTATGRLLARANGTAQVLAVVDVDTAVVAVTVAQVLHHYTFEPGTLVADALTQVLAAAAAPRDARNNAIGLAGLAPTWSIGDATVGNVNPTTGQVSSLRNGTTYLFATRGAVTDSVLYIVNQRAVQVTMGPDPVPPLTSLGDQVQLTVRAFDSQNQELRNATPSWFALDPATIRVDATGLLTGLAIGTGRVVVSVDGVADTASVGVSNVVTSVAATPDTALVTSVGDTVTFGAVARNARAEVVPGTVAWRTPDVGVAEVLADGQAVALAVGFARIIATVGSRSDTAIFRVTNLPAFVQLQSAVDSITTIGGVDTPQVTVRNARGAALSRSTLVWSSDDAAIARVNAQGIVTALDSGQVFIRASFGLLRDSVLYTIINDQVPAALNILPLAIQLNGLGATDAPPIVVLNALGDTLPRTSVAWSSDDATIARVSLQGVVTAVEAGQVYVRAVSGRHRDSVAVTVVNTALADTVRFLDDERQLALLGAVDTPVVTLRNAIGEPLARSSVAWSSDDETIARVTLQGVVTAVDTGRTYVRASSGARRDSVLYRVLNALVPDTVRILPEEWLLPLLGAVDTPAVDFRNALGDPVPRNSATWASDDQNIVRVTSQGVVTAVDTGATYVRASYGVRRDSVRYTVINSLLPDTIRFAETDRFLTSLGAVDTPVVLLRNALGNDLPRSAATWTSDDQNIVRVSPIGVVTALDTGSTLVRVTSGVRTDSVRYTVSNDPVSISILGRTPDTLTAVGQQLTYTVELRNGRGVPILGYPVAWVSSDPTQVGVDTAAGVATATVIGFGPGVELVAVAGAVRDTVVVVPTNLSRLLVDNSVVVVGPRTGTGTRPFASIQAAVDVAEANDTVFVRRGTGIYRESLRLTRRLTLLGDSGAYGDPNAFVTTRNPAVLPLLAHDTGAAAITAYTTAQQFIRYLAIRHTLDGPALDADGSDAQLDWVYVNPPGTVTSKIGRGISLRNSPSGASIRNARVRDVRGYGLRLENVSEVLVTDDSIIGVDSILGVEEGAAVKVIGGTQITFQRNYVARSDGPLFSAAATGSLTIAQNAFYGRQQGVVVDAPIGNVSITSDTFDLNFQTGNDGQGSAFDGRAAVTVRNKTTTTSASVFGNTFRATVSNPATFTQGSMDATAVVDARSVTASRNSYQGLRYALRTNNARSVTMSSISADSTSFGVFVYSQGADTISLYNDTLVATPRECVSASRTLGTYVYVTNAYLRCSHRTSTPMVYFYHYTQSADTVVYQPGSLYLSRSTLRARYNGVPVYFRGVDFQSDSVRYEAATDPADSVPFGGYDAYTAAVQIDTARYVFFRKNEIVGFHRRLGLSLSANDYFYFFGNRIHQNRFGFRYYTWWGATPFNYGGYSCSPSCSNDVFDNDSAGVIWNWYTVAFTDSVWWGDGRGPRNGPNSSATGDSVENWGSGATFLSATRAAYTRDSTVGVAPFTLRKVHGDNQVRFATLSLGDSLTVRVVDAQGAPVQNVSVTFTVTAGGGNIWGASSATRVTNADGLAEVRYTMGPSGGTVNTIAVTGTNASLGTVTFTATSP
jgi:hypothetical protein